MPSIHHQFIITAIKKDFPSRERFLKFKKQFYSEHKLPQPTNADIRELYEKMIAQKQTKRKPSFEKSMLSRVVRTQSGVAVVAVLTKPYDCPGKCAFCPNEDNMPKSYLSNEPAVMRAIMNKFNPYKQIQSRLHALMLNGHSTDKIELIVMGGTFSYFPKRYQTWFIKECFRACNEYPQSRKSKGKSQKSLLEEQRKNEKAKTRIVGLTLETRPDWINQKEIINFRRLGCTRVELGVQSIYDEILKKNNRGHLTDATIQATKLLKEASFKINYHMMPGLYGSTPGVSKVWPTFINSQCNEDGERRECGAKGRTFSERPNKKLSQFSDFQMFKTLFTNSDYQPDMLKIYPTVVIKETLLYRWWKEGKYQPLDNKVFEELVIKIKNEAIPPYVRIQRLVRDVPLPSIEAGPTISNLRQIIAPKAHCQCIRCREIKDAYGTSQKFIKSKVENPEPTLNRISYSASGGQEIFLQFIDQNSRLYALLRLRINNLETTKNHFIPELQNSAIIREVHTYGKLVPISKNDKVNGEAGENTMGHKNSPQHTGLGKQLLKEAEEIARKGLTKLGIPKSKQKITVISGIGVRDYYRKNDYRLQGTYMVKGL